MGDAVSPCRQVVTTIYATLGEMAVVDAVNELYSNTLLCNRKSVEKLAQLASKVLASFTLLLLFSLPCLALPPYLDTPQRFLLAPERTSAGCCLTRCKEGVCSGGRRMCCLA